TGLRTARLGYKTIIMSLDIAHNLSDIFDLDKGLMDLNKGKPVKIAENLWIQELDIHQELQRNWKEVHSYLSLLLSTSGFDNVLAEELAILPGMEEVSALLYINRYIKANSYDVIVLDCAPTGEAIRFISIPTALEWYIKKIFNLERNIAKFVRPIVKRVTDIPIPEDSYFENINQLFTKLQGSDEILSNPEITSVRLVTNPEKIVLKETLRAFMYLNLYKINVDLVILNRILPLEIQDRFFDAWKEIHTLYTLKAREYFDPIPIFSVDLFTKEILGLESIERLGEALYKDQDPTHLFYKGKPYEFSKEDGCLMIKIELPFAQKEEVEVYRVGDELVLKLGAFRRNIPLPRSALASCERMKARMQEGYLQIYVGGKEDGE
ncbi:MAG: TRC40/GET3/ArsA family transport-energizing ATPase, partial [Desulfatiglandales bacterium]